MTEQTQQQSLAFAKQILLEPAGLTEQHLHDSLGILMAGKVDAADLYFQWQRSESWHLEDGIVRDAAHNIEQGVGVRAMVGETTGFACTDNLNLASLTHACKTAAAVGVHTAGEGSGFRKSQLTGINPVLHYPAVSPIDSLSSEEKTAWLRELDAIARAEDPRVEQVSVSLAASHEVVMILNDDGLLAADVRPLMRINVHVIAAQDGRREQGSSGGGGRGLFELIQGDTAVGYAKEAVRQALVNLNSQPAPAGEMPVVLGNGWPGVLLHEAIGHGLEGDFNRKGSSAFSDKMGQRVASELCTVVDDGTLSDRRGSLNIDDEGTPTQCTTLIKNGILQGYMQDKLNARLMGVAPTGNGRRESYAYLPLPRMTNTYMLNGPHLPEDIISSVEEGIYAVNFGGGQVDITSGKFVFSASEAYKIENGKVTYPVKGATLIGDGPTVLKEVSMVGNDLALDAGVGVCGKEGQSVPVGVGQPTLRVDKLTVGGTQV